MEFPRASILGIGFFVPEKILANRDLEKMVDTTDEWIFSRTGIRERRIAEKGVGTSDLAKEAALRALQDAGVKAEEVDLLIVATTTPDMPLPSTACLVQEKIGAKNAVAFDQGAACAGFVYALVTAEQFLKTGTYRTALVVGADLITAFIDWSDRSTCILFGDGAGAVVMRGSKTGGILSSVLGSDGRHADLLKISCGGSKYPASSESIAKGGHYLQMTGSEVFKLAVRGMSDAIQEALKKAGLSASDIHCLVPHQANRRIIDAVAERLQFPSEKIFINLEKYGNTSAASCAIALSEAVTQGRIKRGDKVLLATFGSGLVWGALVMEW